MTAESVPLIKPLESTFQTPCGVVGAGWGWMLREEQAERPACRSGPVGQQQRKGLDVYIQSGEGQFGPRQEPGAPGDPFYLDGGKQA